MTIVEKAPSTNEPGRLISSFSDFLRPPRVPRAARGSISGEKLSSDAPRPTGKAVQLEQNFSGYFTDFECGESCGAATVAWDENGYRYTVGIKAGKMDDIVRVANSAISNTLY